MDKPRFSFQVKEVLLFIIIALLFGFVIQDFLLEDFIHSFKFPYWLESIVEFTTFLVIILPFFYFLVYRELSQKTMRDERLLDEYATFKTILEQSPSAAFIYGEHGFIYVSPTFCSILGCQHTDVIGKTFAEITFLNNATVTMLTEFRSKRFNNESVPQAYNIPAFKKDGKEIVLEMRPKWSAFKGELVTVGTIVDVTDKVLISKQKKENEQKYRSLFEKNMDAAFILHINGIITDVNPIGLVMTGQTREEVIGKSFFEFIAPQNMDRATERFKLVLSGQAFQHEFKVAIKGENYLYDVSVMPIMIDGVVQEIFGLARDVTEQRRTDETIKWLAYHDSLTGLPNRRSFIENLESEISKSVVNEESLALFYLDLDRVKAVNDNLGHEVGDMFLKQASERLQDVVNGKGMVARIGGDEFALLLKASKQEAEEVAKEILYVFSVPFLLGEQTVPGNTSIGIAQYPTDASDTPTLLRNADKALYIVKHHGGGNYAFFEASMKPTNSYRFSLQADFQRALQEEEFFLMYQPKVNANTGDISGVEALLRWKTKSDMIIPPDEFIPLAEETGFIVPLGEWVIREACQQNKKWQEAGYSPIRIAVNVSAVQFQRSNIEEVIEKVLFETGLDPKWLEIEITEGTLMEVDKFTIRSITRLKEIGVTIALDDFGTGYSSMQYLKKFRLHSLKVDRSFIQDLHEHHDRAAITEAITQLAHGLGMKVVAEGVEKNEELELIKTIGADEIQGYYISRPLLKEDLEGFLETRNRMHY